jgi:hypothetical protein
MSKNSNSKDIRPTYPVNESILFENISRIIEDRRATAAAYANREGNLMFREIGRYINSVILDFKRAAYGKKIFSTLSRKLIEEYGKSFQEENLYRMAQFANVFGDAAVIENLLTGLSWSHICELIRIKNEQARIYYTKDAAERLERIKSLPQDKIKKQIVYFIDKGGDDDV